MTFAANTRPCDSRRDEHCARLRRCLLQGGWFDFGPVADGVSHPPFGYNRIAVLVPTFLAALRGVVCTSVCLVTAFDASAAGRTCSKRLLSPYLALLVHSIPRFTLRLSSDEPCSAVVCHLRLYASAAVTRFVVRLLTSGESCFSY